MQCHRRSAGRRPTTGNSRYRARIANRILTGTGAVCPPAHVVDRRAGYRRHAVTDTAGKGKCRGACLQQSESPSWYHVPEPRPGFLARSPVKDRSKSGHDPDNLSNRIPLGGVG